MGGFVLDSDIDDINVPVNSKFINNYMIRANGEYVKVYLMLLYYSLDKRKDISLEILGDALEQSEKAVIRALKYWEQMNLLSLKYGGEDDICGVTLRPIGYGNTYQSERTGAAANAQSEKSKSGAAPSENSSNRTCPSDKPDLNKVSRDEEFSALMIMVQKYLGTTLSKKNVESLAYMYDVLGFSNELIEYIVETCAGEGYKSINYMESVAKDWYVRGIVSLEQAKIYGVVNNKDIYKVMKYLGLSGRNPSPTEKETINRWLIKYGFNVGVVEEACNRTIAQIHKPDFNYVEGILKSWLESGVKSLSDIKQLDEKFGKDKQKALKDGQNNKKTYVSKQNRFHNFEQRDVNYDDMKIDISAY